MNIFEVAINAARSKVSPFFVKIKMWTKPSYVKNKFLAKSRNFFMKVFDVRPKNEEDYYPLGWFLVSKRLAFAVVLLTIIICTYFLWITKPLNGSLNSSYKAYRYNSFWLQLAQGKVQILGKSGYTAYVGDVDGGVVTGMGTLYSPKGSMVYQGAFSENKYNGEGVLYYSNQNIKYSGQFVDNQFSGTGKEYREDGSLLYEGNFLKNEKSGEGVLYDSGGKPVFSGRFLNDEVDYKSLLGESTQDAAKQYTGQRLVMEDDTVHCVYLKDISAAYFSKDGSDSLDEERTIASVYVLRSEIPLEGNICSNITEIKEILGEPVYEGNTSLILEDELALNLMIEQEKKQALFGQADVKTTQLYSDVAQIDSYEKDYLAYLYVFEKDDVTYQFFCTDADSTFSFYSLE